MTVFEWEINRTASGQFRQFESAEPFVLESSEPVHVGQFLVSLSWNGDPSFLMFPAVEEWRGTYIFTTGRGFTVNYVSLALPVGADVSLDGDIDVHSSACTDAVPIGNIDGTEYEQIICPIADGVHIVDSGEELVGVTVYGYYGAGSYAYSAGSDLHQIFLI